MRSALLTGPDPDRSTNRLFALAKRFRIGEIVYLSGAPILGGLFACGRMDAAALGRLLGIGAICVLLGLHVGTANDFFDALAGHRRSPDLVTRPPARRWIVVFLLCLCGAAVLGRWMGVLLPVLAIAGCWMLYVAPPVRGKSVPAFSCLLHFIAGALHFALGYAAMGGAWRGGIGGMLYFGLIIVSGQLCHEIQHRDPDAQLGIRTNAYCFGDRAVFAAALALIALSNVCLALFSAAGRFPVALTVAAWGSFAAYAPMWAKALRSGLSPEAIQRFRLQYRGLYAALGLFFAFYLILGKWR